MKKIATLLFFLPIIFFCTCQTYDNAIIYHKNFNSGTNPLLKFNGFYSDSAPPSSNEFNVPSELVRPVFFYADGSAFATTNFNWLTGMDEIVKGNRLNGAWGNYLISGDTIQLEKFQLIENNHVRIILKGIISKDQIHWIKRKYHREGYQSVDYSIYFHPYAAKPDSTLNFTRTLPIYNKK